MNKKIKKVAVLGSGVMGSRIACHFANIGVNVLLLDIAPQKLTKEEEEQGLTLDAPKIKNKIVNSSLESAIKSNPSPLYKKSFASRIKTGNFVDNMKDISEVDWIVEVVVENLEIKKSVFNEVEKYRKSGTIVTTNTSGIPIKMLLEGRSEDFKKNFCGTHFFNPPRYLRLLEIIPSTETEPRLVAFLMHYGDLFLGKTTVLCKDTPAFIANRIGIFSLTSLFHLVESLDFTVDEIDKLTGPIIGRPKSATFRTCDVVGLDTLVHVANFVYATCPNDKAREEFKLPDFIIKMFEKKLWGDKTQQGFYKKIKDESGKSNILSLDLKTVEYKAKGKTKLSSIENTRSIESLKERLKLLIQSKNKEGDFYRIFFYKIFQYSSERVPEVADEIYKIDAALCAGFGWELGPFETWDALGLAEIVQNMEAMNMQAAAWVHEMLNNGITSFYKIENGIKYYYDIPSKAYKIVPGTENFIILENYRSSTVWKNSGASAIDIGDGVLALEFHTKMNTIGGEVLEAINKTIDIAEKDFRGLVIGNDGANFSAGANLAMVFMLAVEQEYDEIDYAIKLFQNTTMRIKYSDIPVVVAPHGLTLGGGCELALHAVKVQAAAETYMGLVEFGVGLIPGGGGTKELVLRASDSFIEGDIELPVLKEKFLTIGMAKVSTSAYEAFDLGLLMAGRDAVTINRNRLIKDAKASVMEIANAGYTPKTPRKNIKVLGKTALGMFYAGANSMFAGNYISEHDKLISQKLANVISGGDLSGINLVTEQYLLDLEREAFLSLCGEKKTLERIQSILTTGKPLRN